MMCCQVTLTVQKTALLTMYQNILIMEQKLNLPSKHTSYVDNDLNPRTLGLITPRTEGDLSRLPVYAPKVSSRTTLDIFAPNLSLFAPRLVYLCTGNHEP
jgi:hypothetical protein